MTNVKIYLGDCRERLATLPAESVHSVITSPPYYGLRDYKTEPGVWGGDADCRHDWGGGLSIGLNPGRKGSKNLNPGKGGSDGQHFQQKTAAAYQSHVCHKCGAWRGNLGLEPTVAMYVEHMVEVFRAIRRVLRKDGTVWLNMGDSYVSAPPGNKSKRSKTDLDGAYHRRGERQLGHGEDMGAIYAKANGSGLKQKDMIAMPWRIGLALQADGWWLRQDIIWAKTNPMPESISDRCTKSHEYLLLLSKSERYYYDAMAIQETAKIETADRYEYSFGGAKNKALVAANIDGIGRRTSMVGERDSNGKRNKRSVWTINAQPFPGSHFAVFPPDLVIPALLAGCPEGGTVLDPFAGAGTVGMVAALYNRSAILIELNPQYVEMAWKRIENELGLQRYKCPVIIDGPVAKVPRYRGKHAKPEATAQNHPR